MSYANEHPIVFNDWSIRRILAGEKTQARRVMNPQPGNHINAVYSVKNSIEWTLHGSSGALLQPRNNHIYDRVKCPYGQPGDRLWVPEAFRLPAEADDEGPREYVDAWEQSRSAKLTTLYEATDDTGEAPGKWGRKRPSIHMPRELCRIRLRVEDVRVERVQDISPSDAHAEGIPRKAKRGMNGEVTGEMDPRGGFKKKWNDIHGDGAWDDNPWVWVVTFSRIDE